jgi:hypothetical protein
MVTLLVALPSFKVYNRTWEHQSKEKSTMPKNLRRLKLRPAYEVRVDLSEWELPKMEEAMRTPISEVIERAVSTGLEEVLQWMVEEDCTAFLFLGDDGEKPGLTVGFTALDTHRELWYHVDLLDVTQRFCERAMENDYSKEDVQRFADEFQKCADTLKKALERMS